MNQRNSFAVRDNLEKMLIVCEIFKGEQEYKPLYSAIVTMVNRHTSEKDYRTACASVTTLIEQLFQRNNISKSDPDAFEKLVQKYA